MAHTTAADYIVEGDAAEGAAPAGNPLRVAGWDGTNIRTLRTDSSGNLTTTVTEPQEWSINHVPAANTKATISKAAGAAGVKHVCTSIVATLAASAVLAAGVVATVQLRDGATGAGTVLWSANLAIQTAQGGYAQIAIPVHIVGTAATAMTIEFTAAGGADTLESVAITGYDTTA